MLLPHAQPSGVLAKYIDSYILAEETIQWEVKYGFMPNTAGICCYDYGALNFGTDPDTGEIRLKGNVQIIVRHVDQTEAYRMIGVIATKLAAIGVQDLIVLDFDDGAAHLHAVAHRSGPMYVEKDELERFNFSLNVIPTITDF